MLNPFTLAVFVKGTTELRSAVSSAYDWNAKYPRDLVEDVCHCFGALIAQHFDPDVPAISVRCHHVCLAPNMHEID